MRDCAGGQHPDDEPVTWRQFDREMAHRDELSRHKELDIQREVDRKAKDVLAVAEKRASSNRWLIAIIALVALVFQIFLAFRH